MNSKLITILLAIIAISAAAFAIYTGNELSGSNAELEACKSKYDSDVAEWKDKYEEALIDMEEAFKRLEEKDNELKVAMEELQKQKGRK